MRTTDNTLFRTTMYDLHSIFAEAVRLHQQGLFQEAKTRYLQALEILPDNSTILGNLGILSRDLGEAEEALAYCSRAAAAAPDDPSQQINLGAVHEALGRLDSAKACYEKALALNPQQPKALNNLGKILHLLGNTAGGLALVQRAVAIEPDSPVALNNLGVILGALGDTGNAIQHIEKSLQLAPANVETIYNLAGLHNCEGDYARAAELLERLLALQPDHAAASHMLAALRGEATATAPAEYVIETFDRYAGRFDEHLQTTLGYTVPAALAEMTSALFPGRTFQHGLDLGCGTGLAGTAFQPLTEALTGVDLSSQMLLAARKKNIYQKLECKEILQFLDDCSSQYDLVVTADVFIYLGRLEPFFSRLRHVTSPGAILACSIESDRDARDYVLRVTGRYAHNPDYLLSQAENGGFRLLDQRKHNIRKENNDWIAGDLYIFSRSETDPA